ncbi:MAG: hypothetical protein L6Q77_10825 [Bacteroidetes bacterium]|nr:hypothetical protein [Bacteroidota bacterium]
MDSTDLVFAMFGSRDAQTRSLAMRFGKDHVPDQAQFAELVKLGLQDSEPVVREEAQMMLDQVREYVDLEEMLRNPGNAALRNAAITYMKEKVPEMEPLLLRLLMDSDQDIVLFATQISSVKPTQALLQACMPNLFNPDPNIVQSTIELAVNAKEKRVIPQLHKILTHNIWNEMGILDALVKLGDPQVLVLLDDRIKSKSEFTLMAFEIFRANPSLKLLRILLNNSVILLTSRFRDDYLQTIVAMAAGCEADYQTLQDFADENKKKQINLRLKVDNSGKSEELRIATGFLVVWNILDESGWMVSEWLDLLNQHENGASFKSILVDQNWQMILAKLAAEPFSQAVFDYLLLNKPELIPAYLQTHYPSLRPRLNLILQALNDLDIQVPGFLHPVIEEDLNLLSPETVRKLVAVNPELVSLYKKLLDGFGESEELISSIFECCDQFPVLPDEIFERLTEYAGSGEFQKRQAAVKGIFLARGRNLAALKTTLANDPVLEVRIEVYQCAFQNADFMLINSLKISDFMDPVEIFYLTRLIGASNNQEHLVLLELLYDKTSGNLKNQVEMVIHQMNERFLTKSE